LPWPREDECVDAPFVLDLAVQIEDLDAMVAGVRNVELALEVADAGGGVEEAWVGAGAAEVAEESALSIEDGDALVVGVGDVDVSGGIHRDVGGVVEFTLTVAEVAEDP
jgi:hypothetical protein